MWKRSKTAFIHEHMSKQRTHGFWYGFNVTASLLALFFLFLVPFLQAFDELTKTVDLHLNLTTPIQIGEKTEVQVYLINASSTFLDAIEFEILYDTDTLELHSISPTDTLCEDRFLLTKTITNASGTVLFQCGTITPFSKTEGIVATLQFTSLQSGTTSISFGTSSTQVLMHNGLGTDATRSRTNLVFTAL